MTREDESKVREIVKTAIEKEFEKIQKKIDSLDKKIITKQQIKDLMASAFVKQHKFMWEKSKFITSYFNDL
jgi:hypothetical protein